MCYIARILCSIRIESKVTYPDLDTSLISNNIALWGLKLCTYLILFLKISVAYSFWLNLNKKASPYSTYVISLFHTQKYSFNIA